MISRASCQLVMLMRRATKATQGSISFMNQEVNDFKSVWIFSLLWTARAVYIYIRRIIIHSYCCQWKHLFAVHHLMVEEEEHSLLALDLRLRQLSHLPGKDEMGAPAEDVFTLRGSKYKARQLLSSPVAADWTIMKKKKKKRKRHFEKEIVFRSTSQSSMELCHRMILSMFSRRRFLSLISLATFFMAFKAASTSL